MTPTTYRNPAVLNPDHRSDADAFGGVQFGYNFQSPGAFVYGIEVDLGGMSLNGRGRANGNTSVEPIGGAEATTPLRWPSTGTPRRLLRRRDRPARLDLGPGSALRERRLCIPECGPSHRRSLIYDNVPYAPGLLGGGAGWCDFNQDHNTTLTGWTVGGGLEWKVSPLWSIKVEYLHFEFEQQQQQLLQRLVRAEYSGGT